MLKPNPVNLLMSFPEFAEAFVEGHAGGEGVWGEWGRLGVDEKGCGAFFGGRRGGDFGEGSRGSRGWREGGLVDCFFGGVEGGAGLDFSDDSNWGFVGF